MVRMNGGLLLSSNGDVFANFSTVTMKIGQKGRADNAIFIKLYRYSSDRSTDKEEQREKVLLHFIRHGK